jgi:hypothetical protein
VCCVGDFFEPSWDIAFLERHSYNFLKRVPLQHWTQIPLDLTVEDPALYLAVRIHIILRSKELEGLARIEAAHGTAQPAA